MGYDIKPHKYIPAAIGRWCRECGLVRSARTHDPANVQPPKPNNRRFPSRRLAR